MKNIKRLSVATIILSLLCSISVVAFPPAFVLVTWLGLAAGGVGVAGTAHLLESAAKDLKYRPAGLPAAQGGSSRSADAEASLKKFCQLDLYSSDGSAGPGVEYDFVYNQNEQLILFLYSVNNDQWRKRFRILNPNLELVNGREFFETNPEVLALRDAFASNANSSWYLRSAAALNPALNIGGMSKTEWYTLTLAKCLALHKSGQLQGFSTSTHNPVLYIP